MRVFVCLACAQPWLVSAILTSANGGAMIAGWFSLAMGIAWTALAIFFAAREAA
tara:strand:- start:186 stop:347 length:162 start_codon:yes stop_codon:yes gene_type:complete